MGTDYFFYTEAKIDNTWYGIDPRILRLQNREEPLTYKINYTYWNGSRSYFGETYDKLKDISKPIRLEDTSTEFRIDHLLGWRGDDKDAIPYYDNMLRVMNFSQLMSLNSNKKMHDYHGLYRKDSIALFEAGEIEDLYDDISPEDYSALDDEAKKVYQYYEWDDPMGWRRHIPILVERVSERVREFEDMNYLICDDIRIIMYAC